MSASMSFLSVCSPSGRSTPQKFFLRLQTFDTGLEFMGAKLANPCDPKLRAVGSALQTYDRSGLQIGSETANARPGLGDIDGMRQTSNFIDGSLTGNTIFVRADRRLSNMEDGSLLRVNESRTSYQSLWPDRRKRLHQSQECTSLGMTIHTSDPSAQVMVSKIKVTDIRLTYLHIR